MIARNIKNGNRCEVYLKYIDLVKVLFENEDYNFILSRISDMYFKCASDMARVNNSLKTQEYLKLSLEYADKFDSMDKPVKYTSKLFNMLEYKPKEVLNPSIKGERTRIINMVNDEKAFDFIRDEEEFKEFI